jgi:hypothetical protein
MVRLANRSQDVRVRVVELQRNRNLIADVAQSTIAGKDLAACCGAQILVLIDRTGIGWLGRHNDISGACGMLFIATVAAALCRSIERGSGACFRLTRHTGQDDVVDEEEENKK